MNFRQQGVALITALLVVALATVAAVAMATRQQLDIHRTGNLLHSEQAYAYALGAESWARVVLARDKQDTQIDTLDEDWATRPPVSIVEGGSVVGRILDMQGRFNVNSLVNGQGVAVASAVERYKRLLRLLDLDDSLADPLVDWMDKDLNVRFPDGAEDQEYLLLDPSYRVSNQRLADISELRLVKGYQPDVIAKLQPFVVALPDATTINVNTASAEVLATLANGLTVADGEALIEARKQTYFQSVSTLEQHSALAGKTVDAGAADVKTEWFLMVSEANIGQGRARLASLIQRTDDTPRVIRRQREFAESVTLPAAQEDE